MPVFHQVVLIIVFLVARPAESNILGARKAESNTFEADNFFSQLVDLLDYRDPAKEGCSVVSIGYLLLEAITEICLKIRQELETK